LPYPYQEISNLRYYINGEEVTKNQYEAIGLSSPEAETLLQGESSSNQEFPFPDSGDF